MSKTNDVDLGMVKSLSVTEKPGSDDRLMLMGSNSGEERWMKIVTKGAAQTLWFYLTQILFPRAADQITPRAATAMLTPVKNEDATASFLVKANEQHEMILVQALGDPPWKMYFSYDEGRELWASLEDILDAV